MTLVYLDTETTGLNPQRHHIWEVAWAVDDGPIHSDVVAHSLIGAEPKALEVGNYHQRMTWGVPSDLMHDTEAALADALEGATIVGANPRFDAAFLEARWGKAPWKYRLLDIEAYAMPFAGWEEPRGLSQVAEMLRSFDFDIPEPDHTAAGDVATLRACHLALREIYKEAP